MGGGPLWAMTAPAITAPRPLPRLLVPKDVEGSGLLADTGAFP